MGTSPVKLMAKKRLRTQADLKEAATDVAFEFKMFRQGFGLLDRSSPSLGNNNAGADLLLSPPSFSTGKNCTPSPVVSPRSEFCNMEGILIHFRNLMEFFF